MQVKLVNAYIKPRNPLIGKTEVFETVMTSILIKRQKIALLNKTYEVYQFCDIFILKRAVKMSYAWGLIVP